MVSEPWILKLGNQVSTNLKHGLGLHLENSKKLSNKKQGQEEKQVIGILSFEVANVMSNLIHLHKSLSDHEMVKLKNEILNSEGIRTLVSNNETQLLELALVEKLDDLNRVASVVSRLGKKCTIPALRGFKHVYGDIVSGVIDVKQLGILVKNMDSMVRKMEKYVDLTASLYTQMGVMNELEMATKRFQQNKLEESRKAFEQKLIWQKQDVNHLKDISLWNQSHDKVVEILARTVCTVYSQISTVFGDALLKSGELDVGSKVQRGANCHFHSGPTKKRSMEKKTVYHGPRNGPQKSERGLFGPEDISFVCSIGPGGLFMSCLSSSVPKVDDDDDHHISGCVSDHFSRDRTQLKVGLMKGSRFWFKSKLLTYALSNTVGGSALALHYANVIIVIEKLLQYPHLVRQEARDDLYQMLPRSLRNTLKTNLKPYAKDMVIYDAHIAHDWWETLDKMLKWLAPLAHNMMRWQSERNFEQQQIVNRTNVLLLQTLYFADQEKTEADICQLLVGLNYICGYENQQNALLDCASSFDVEDSMEWQL